MVSLAKTAKPSNAVLLANGFVDCDKMFFAQTLFKESDIEIFSLGKFKVNFIYYFYSLLVVDHFKYLKHFLFFLVFLQD